MTRLWKTVTLPMLFTLAALSGAAAVAHADVLNMPKDSTAAPAVSVTLPGRGMSMTQVEERFGAPRQKLPAVGDPPITRWIYPDFTVYFEYQYVINAVSHVSGPAPTAPEGVIESDTATPPEAETMEVPKPDAMMPADPDTP